MMADRLARGRLPLRGADLVLMAMHDRWKRAGISSNAMLIVDSDGPVEPDRVRRALGRFVERCPWPAARLARPFPWASFAGWPAPMHREGRRRSGMRALDPARRSTARSRRS